ncbi:PepSY domain-containing protein [Dokdonia sp. PRO95]|uniref:PepSY domain-containing protein n=1 Tax=Dokdonia sp. PRO95 TaxID=1239415 RepID=UPI000553CB6E|nr:PepSY domain-containing protein [Dokdonia sp. PRO95]
MARKKSTSLKMRILHRYLGFFLAGIMAVYAISGIVLIFRDSDTFKNTVVIEKTLDPNLSAQSLAKAVNNKRLKVTKEESGILYFKEGTYNSATGAVVYSKKELPFILDKLTHFHKAKSGDPLYFLNIFFGLSLLFFVVSSFWMFIPSSPIYRKGMLFVAGGIALALILLFV